MNDPTGPGGLQALPLALRGARTATLRRCAQVIELITAAQARGQARLVEMNQQVLGNLDRIIATLDDDGGPVADQKVSDAR